MADDSENAQYLLLVDWRLTMIRRVLLVSAFMLVFFAPIVKAADSDTRCGESRYWWESRFIDAKIQLRKAEGSYYMARERYLRVRSKVRFTEAEEREFKQIESDKDVWSELVEQWGGIIKMTTKKANECDVPSWWRK